MTVTVLQGDCLKVMAEMEDNSVDLICTDPPYEQTSLEWDRTVDGWLPEADRILKPTGSLWMYGTLRSLSPFVADAERGQLGSWKFAQDIVWEKHNGSGFQNDRFRRVHEQAAQFYRGAWADVWNKPVMTYNATNKTVRRKTRPAHMGEIGNSVYVSKDGGPKLMRSVFHEPSCHGHAIHPTQKPEAVIRPLIEASCPPGGLVLDPFFGSGTTGVVARQLQMECIGIEISPEYVEAARRRIANIPEPLTVWQPEPSTKPEGDHA